MFSYKCPKCQNNLTLRRGKFGEFYGCSNFPTCRQTVPVSMIEKYKDTGSSNGSPKKKLSYNDFQINFFDALQNTDDNIIMRACAGSGKTTTLEHGVDYIPEDKSVVYLVFNKKLEMEAQTRMPARCKVKTSHSFGLWSLRGEFPKVKVQPNKLKNATYDYWKAMVDSWQVPQNDKWKLVNHLSSVTQKTVSLLKNRLEMPTPENINDLLETYDIDISPDTPQFNDYLKGVKFLYEATAEDVSCVDFDDMLFFPWFYGLEVPKFDFVLTDEIQDFNAAQIDLILKAVGERAVGVGDESQSIYGFRAALLNSMQVFEETLNCKPYPLSMTFRVPQIGVKRINQKFPEIDFLPWENAPEGEIEDIRLEEFLIKAQDGDLVVCRNNAPLIKPVYRLIRQGKKAVVVGQDIGAGIKKLFDRQDGVTERTTIGTAVNSVLKDIQKKKDYYAKQEKWSKVAALDDRMDTITDLADGCRFVKDMYDRIDLIFTDELAGISFSTVHKAKGLEAKNVGILYPELMPSSYASQDWEIQQERNIEYVAETRFRERMSFIRD